MGFEVLNGRRFWITGASSGIGRAVALELGRHGARMAVSGRNEQALAEVVDVAGGPERVVPVAFDVTDRQANLDAAGRVREVLGGLDTALFNAGTCEYVDIRNWDSSLFERVMQSNFMGMVYGIEAALPLLRDSPDPHLVGMSSTVGYRGLPRAEAYGASKAAITNMLEGLRVHLRAEGIPVTVISPGFVRTPLTDRNDFAMPMRIEADEAARIIVRGLTRRPHEIHFPRAFSLTYKLLSILPSRLYTWLAFKSLIKDADADGTNEVAGNPPGR